MSTLPPTFLQLMDIRKAAGSFAELMAAQDLADWLPSALDSLAAVVMAALHSEGDQLTPEVRLQACQNAFDEFAAAGKERVAGAIGKRQAARVAKVDPDASWAKGIL